MSAFFILFAPLYTSSDAGGAQGSTALRIVKGNVALSSKASKLSNNVLQMIKINLVTFDMQAQLKLF